MAGAPPAWPVRPPAPLATSVATAPSPRQRPQPRRAARRPGSSAKRWMSTPQVHAAQPARRAPRASLEGSSPRCTACPGGTPNATQAARKRRGSGFSYPTSQEMAAWSTWSSKPRPTSRGRRRLSQSLTRATKCRLHARRRGPRRRPGRYAMPRDAQSAGTAPRRPGDYRFPGRGPPPRARRRVRRRRSACAPPPVARAGTRRGRPPGRGPAGAGYPARRLPPRRSAPPVVPDGAGCDPRRGARRGGHSWRCIGRMFVLGWFPVGHVFLHAAQVFAGCGIVRAHAQDRSEGVGGLFQLPLAPQDQAESASGQGQVGIEQHRPLEVVPCRIELVQVVVGPPPQVPGVAGLADAQCLVCGCQARGGVPLSQLQLSEVEKRAILLALRELDGPAKRLFGLILSALLAQEAAQVLPCPPIARRLFRSLGQPLFGRGLVPPGAGCVAQPGHGGHVVRVQGQRLPVIVYCSRHLASAQGDVPQQDQGARAGRGQHARGRGMAQRIVPALARNALGAGSIQGNTRISQVRVDQGLQCGRADLSASRLELSGLPEDGLHVARARISQQAQKGLSRLASDCQGLQGRIVLDVPQPVGAGQVPGQARELKYGRLRQRGAQAERRGELAL